jgi:PDZ domain-containing secreted protein
MMNHILALSFVLFTVGQDKLTFQPGQSVYIVAKTTDTTIDLRAEVETRSEFEKQNKFKTSSSAANADFVFFVLTEYKYSYSSEGRKGDRKRIVKSPETLEAAIALVIPSKEYSEHKNDLEKLREVSIWQGQVYPSLLAVSPSKLVKDFHKHIEKE